MDDRLIAARDTVLGGGTITRETAALLASDEIDIYDLLHAANRIRRHFKGDKIEFCSIVNAKSGGCSEDCSFCSQSAHYTTASPRYPMMPREQIVSAALDAAKNGAKCFGVVISGLGPNAKEVAYLEEVYRDLSREAPLRAGGALGVLSREDAQRLYDAGMRMVNHNLETSERHFPKICTTHTWQDRVDTLRNAKAVGMELCSGVIFGMGEDADDRIDVLGALHDIGADSVPMNFLHRIEGTPLQTLEPMQPMEILRWIAVARFLLPDRNIRICGGRESNLRDLQSWMFYAGANAALMGNYLTTIGRSPEDDRKMVEDLGLRVTEGCGEKALTS